MSDKKRLSILLPCSTEATQAQYISDNSSLKQVCAYLQTSKILAIDTEFIREKTYYPELCLIQLASQNASFLIDPVSISDFEPLSILFEDTSIIKIFHACSQDLEALSHSLNCSCSPIFDTQLAAAFLGERLQISLSAVVETYLGIHLDKTESLTDWSMRPLSDMQLKYAAEDVMYLPAVYSMMCDRLIENDRLQWFYAEMDALLCQIASVHDPEKQYLRLRHAGMLTKRQMAIARELCVIREIAAAKANIPKRWLISDESIVELCKKRPLTYAEIRSVRGTDKIFAYKLESRVLEGIKKGAHADLSNISGCMRKPHPSLEQESVLDLMNALLRLIAKEHKIAAQLIATRDDLFALYLNQRDCSLLSGWRYELAGKRLLALISGEIGLTVKDGHIEQV